MRFFIVEIEYSTGPEPDAEDQTPPRHKTLVVYQFIGTVPSDGVGLERILSDDMRHELNPMESTDGITLVAEITDPMMLRVLKLWNQRCIDFDSRLFEEGRIFRDTSNRRTGRVDEDRENIDSA